MTTMITLGCEMRAIHARPVRIAPAVAYAGAATSSGDLTSLLQVAASVLHLVDRQLDPDFRPLVQAGLAAITAAGNLIYTSVAAAPHLYALEA